MIFKLFKLSSVVSLPSSAFMPDKTVCTEKRQGFTLIEVTIAIAVLVILLGFIIGPMLVGFDYFHKGDARVDIRQNAAIAMETILKDVREAMYVYAIDDLGNIVIDGDVYDLWIWLPSKTDINGNAENILDEDCPINPLNKNNGDKIHYYTKDRNTNPRLYKEVYSKGSATVSGQNAVVGNIKTETKFNCSKNGIVTIDITAIKIDNGDGTEHRLHLTSKARPMIK